MTCIKHDDECDMFWDGARWIYRCTKQCAVKRQIGKKDE